MSEIETNNLAENMDEKEAKVYEIGFHIIPTISEEEVKAEFEAVKKILEGNKAVAFISEGLPTLKNLSYTLSKTVKAVKTTYSKAYFAWLKFTAFPEQIAEIKKIIDEDASIIRYLIISTVRENTMVGKYEPAKEDEEEETDSKEEKIFDPKIIEDLDKTIDELVVQ